MRLRVIKIDNQLQPVYKPYIIIIIVAWSPLLSTLPQQEHGSYLLLRIIILIRSYDRLMLPGYDGNYNNATPIDDNAT